MLLGGLCLRKLAICIGMHLLHAACVGAAAATVCTRQFCMYDASVKAAAKLFQQHQLVTVLYSEKYQSHRNAF